MKKKNETLLFIFSLNQHKNNFFIGLKFHVSNKLKFGYMANVASDVMSVEEKKADFKNSYVDFLGKTLF